MYRGLVLLALSTLFPYAPDALIYVAAVVAFAPHAYQGWAGILSTGALDAIFVALYALTGSVLPGMLLHFLVDARAAVTTPGR